MTVPAGRPDLSVVVLSWNTCALTLACLRALECDAGRLLREVIVVDNGSDDGSPARIAAEFPRVRLLRNAENRGYSEANNQGARQAQGRYLCLLNSDTEVRPGALDALVAFLDAHPRYGAVAPKLLNVNGTVQPACMRFPGLATAWVFDTIWGRFPPGSWVVGSYHMRDFDHHSSRDVAQPPGTCLVLSRQEFLDRGALDPSFFLFFGDVDLCRRLWTAGRRIRYLAESEVVHHGGGSTRRFREFVVTWHRDRMAYYRKHYGRWVTPYLRLVVRMRALEEWVKAGYACADRAARVHERARIQGLLRRILAP